MTANITTYPSGVEYLADLFGALLPSKGWVCVRDLEGEKVFELPHGLGFVAFLVAGDVVRVSGFPVFDSSKSVEGQAGAYVSSLPRFVVPAGAVDCWTVVGDRRVAGVVRSGSVYYSFYAGLIECFGSTRQYPFPCFLGGSGDVDGLYKSAYPFHGGGALHCPKVCCPDGSWQLVGGQSVVSYSSFDASQHVSYVFPFNARFRSLGPKVDGSHLLFPALVVSSYFDGSASRDNAPIGSGERYADDGQWLGYLEGVFVTTQGLPPGSMLAVEGVDYLVVPNVDRASETYLLRLS
jgi:hypothetical protein